MLGRVVVLLACATPMFARADGPGTGDANTVTWHTYAAFRNDAMSELVPPLDDQGFTHDNAFTLRRQDGRVAFGGGFLHRWITSRRDRRRWDQLDIVALVERTWPHQIVTTARLGPTLGGNFGGRFLQNGWHVLTNTGPTLDEGLQDTYPDGRKLGVLVGLRTRAMVGDERLHGYGVVDAQLAVGQTGVTSIEAAAGGSASTRHVGAHVEVVVTRYHVNDPLLALPGGYRPGWQFEWRVGVHVAWSRFRLSYQYRANESGSGEPIGVIAFQSRR